MIHDPSPPVRYARMTFLGTGTSTGVPVIGCGCAVCKSSDPRNNRMRSSVLFETEEISLLIDSGPDLRDQCLRMGITKVDAVLYTHGHMDHVVGFDELRAFCWSRDTPLPMYANAGCMATLKTMFGWAFAETNIYRGYVKPDPIIFDECFSIGSLKITPLPVHHGSVETNGFLFQRENMRSLAYLPDVKMIPQATKVILADCDILVIDALHERSHPTHMNCNEAIAMIDELKVNQAYLTHCSHEIDHSDLEKKLPKHIRVAYDALVLDL